MPGQVKPGVWMVSVPGAVASLRYRGDPEPTSPTRIHGLLAELGFLDNVPRHRDSSVATIAVRLGERYKGLIAD